VARTETCQLIFKCERGRDSCCSADVIFWSRGGGARGANNGRDHFHRVAVKTFTSTEKVGNLRARASALASQSMCVQCNGAKINRVSAISTCALSAVGLLTFECALFLTPAIFLATTHIIWAPPPGNSLPLIPDNRASCRSDCKLSYTVDREIYRGELNSERAIQ
jgi:hypothetical protein